MRIETRTLAVLVQTTNSSPGWLRERGITKVNVTARVVFLDPSAEDGIQHPSGYEGNDREWADLRQITAVESDQPSQFTTEFLYCDVYRLNVYELTAMAKRLTAVTKAWHKKWDEDGSADSMGEFVLRFARSIGAKTLVTEKSARSHEVSGIRYNMETLAEGKATVNRQVWDILHPAEAAVTV